LDNLKKVVTWGLIIAFAVIVFPLNSIAYASSVLKIGSTGEEVKQVQSLLSDRGLIKSSHITGYYGPITYNAVKTFQIQNALQVDGIVGPATMGKLKQSSGEPETSSSVLKLSKNIYKLEDRGPDISVIQGRLKELGFYNHYRITQYYGPITEEAVKDFQKANALKVDGIVGPATIRKLEKSDISKSSSVSSNNMSEGLSNKVFKLGDSDLEVSTIQRRLKELGFYTYHSITQYYGPITGEAVRDFQRANGLRVDGITGSATKSKLFSADAISKNDKAASITSNGETSRGISTSPPIDANDIINFAKRYLGVPYVYGGNGPSAFDCSGLTTFVFKNFGIFLPRRAVEQANASIGTKIATIDALKPADLVFFSNLRGDERPVQHVGIYIGGGNFIHATSAKNSRKVVISTLSSGYYREGFCWGRRVLK